MTVDPTTPEPRAKIRIEAFDPAQHDRTGFSSGTKQIDNFLKTSAKKFQKGDMSRFWVAVTPPEKNVIGYYAINMGSIDVRALGDLAPRQIPGHGDLPATYIAAIGVNEKLQGLGYGRVILAHALKKIANVSEELGCWAAILDVLDDGDEVALGRRKQFYLERGFISLPSNPLRMFIPVKNIKAVYSQTTASKESA